MSGFLLLSLGVMMFFPEHMSPAFSQPQQKLVRRAKKIALKLEDPSALKMISDCEMVMYRKTGVQRSKDLPQICWAVKGRVGQDFKLTIWSLQESAQSPTISGVTGIHFHSPLDFPKLSFLPPPGILPLI